MRKRRILLPAAVLAAASLSTAAAATAAPDQWDLVFDFVQVGHTSAPQTVTYTNAHSARLKVKHVRVTGRNATDFALSDDGCSGATLAPKATCRIGVAFHPQAAGTRVASVEIVDADQCATWVHVAGSGTATPVAGASARGAACSDGASPVPGSDLGAVKGEHAVSTSPARSCKARKDFRIRVHGRKAPTFKRIAVRIDGHKFDVIRGHRLRATIHVNGLPKRAFKLVIRATTTKNKTIELVRHYKACTRR